MDNQNSGGKRLIVIIAIIILVAIGLAIWFSLRTGGSNNVTTPEQLNFSAAQALNRTAGLDVPDQFPGVLVYVSRVDFPAGGFVVIRQGATSTPGNIIGATFFDKNTRIGNVNLSESTIDSQSYVAEGWTDDGDAIFSPTIDKIIIKTDGTMLQVPFKATKNLPTNKG